MTDDSMDADGTETDTDRSSRRDLLRKGAVAAGVTAATWAAPSIQGLSLRQDYAAAASCSPATGNAAWSSVGCGTGNCLSGTCNSNLITGACGNMVVSGTVATGHPQGSSNFSLTVPPGPATSPFTVPVSFGNVDPPFVSCAVTGFTAMTGSPGCTTQNAMFTANTVMWDFGVAPGFISICATTTANFSVTVSCTCA